MKNIKEKRNFINFWTSKNRVLPFTGREKELEIINETFESILKDEGKIIIIEGEVGFGKSRILMEVENIITETNFQIFTSRGINDEKFMSPIDSMISDFFHKIDNRSQKIAKYIKPEELSELSIINPDLLEFYPFEVQQAKEVNFEKVYNSLFKFLKRLSKFYPIILIFDEADYLNDKVVKFLEFLNFNISNMPILIIFSFENYNQKIQKNFHLFKIFQHIKLKPFNQVDVKNILFKLFYHVPSIKFINWLFNRTKGNPFYIEEIIKSLVKMNIISYEKDKWIVKHYYEDFPLQDNIISFIENKINNLSEDRLKILKTLCLLGNHFTFKDIEKLLDSYPKNKLLNILHILELDGIIDVDEIIYYKFHHPLIKKILIENIEIDEKRHLHRKVAGVIQESYPNRVEDIAFHKTEDLTPKEYSIELVKYLIETSDFFKKHQNWIKAKEYITLAKRISVSIRDITEKEQMIIYVKLLQITGYTGEELPSIEKFYILIERLLALGLKKSAFNISNIYTHRLITNFRFEDAKKILDKNFQILSKEDLQNKWRIMYQKCILELKQDNFDQAIEGAELLVEIVDSKISPIGKWFPINLLGGINYQLGNLEKSKQYFDEALEIIKNVPESKDHLATTYGNLALIYVEIGKIDLSIEFSQKFLEIEIELGNNFKIAKAYNFLSTGFLAKGDLLNAKNCAIKFQEIAMRSENKEIILESNLKLFQIYFQEKNFKEAKEELQTLLSFQNENISSQYIIQINLSKAKISYNEGDFDIAIDYLNNSLSICEKKNLFLAIGEVLSLRAMIYILKLKKSEAMEDFNKAKKIFKENKANFKLSKLFVSFGLSWKGKEKDSILLNGLKLLKDFSLTDEMIRIRKEIRKIKYPLSYAFLKDFFITSDINEIPVKDLQIYTFGGLLIKDQRLKETVSEKVWGSKKAKELLGLLLVLSHKKGVTREVISSYLWPEKNTKEAQNNFHVTLSHLRKVIGCDAIICNEPFYMLNMKKLWIDYFEFIKLDKEFSFFLKQSKIHKAEETIRKLINLYKGDFLQEMYTLPIDDEQIILRIKVKDHILWLLELSKERLEWKEVLNISKNLLQIDPTDERAHRYIIESLYEQGDRSGVIKHYERLKHILRVELGIDPEPETKILFKKLNLNNP